MKQTKSHTFTSQACAAVAGGLLLLASTHSNAQALPNGTVFLNAGGMEQTTPGTVNQSSDGGLETATATLTEGNDPYLYAAATGQSGLGAYAGSDYTYYFEVVGPSGTVPVQVSATGSAQETLFGGVVSYSTISFDIQNGGVYSLQQTASATSTTPGTLSINQTVDLPANTPEEVDISAGVSIFINATASASMDPQISISPTFGQAGEYSLIYSPNIAVPEPSALGLLGVGLGVALPLVRRFSKA